MAKMVGGIKGRHEQAGGASTLEAVMGAAPIGWLPGRAATTCFPWGRRRLHCLK